MKNKIKVLVTVISIIPWSVIAILLLQTKKTVPKTIKTKDTVKIIDTINKKQIDTASINTIPKFFYQSPEEGLEEALIYYDIKHKNIVYAQAILETGNFKSKVCIKHNNLFGLYNSKTNSYYKFNHWTESIIAYKKWIQKNYKYPNDYYTFLEKINYAESERYTKLLRKIVKQKEEDDKRRYITRDSFSQR